MAIILAKDDRTQGSKTAPLTVLEYAAPTCPHCAHFDMDIFPQFKKDYIDTGKVFFIFRVFPLNPVDVAAEAMARCLPEDNYFQFLDLLYRNQAEMGPGRLPDRGRSRRACRHGQDRGHGRAESRQLHRRSGRCRSGFRTWAPTPRQDTASAVRRVSWRMDRFMAPLWTIRNSRRFSMPSWRRNSVTAISGVAARIR